ncbi:hypothetical protein DFH05DRAFT_1560109 [Lentinula detonsa]|uniref:Uncharacterized protein n=1 Tax=Lentinula detonsa TaxID=2804962 RepID=A0A9W8NRV5_9AGAR|nr:hypothetical protein DFH05DRAFT_1560109 [Lentinula detonsa]
MRLLNLALFVTWLVSLAYAVPMSGQASTIASLNIRGHIMNVKKVEVTYDPNAVPPMLSRDLSKKFDRPTSDQISLTPGETQEAEFTVTVNADGKEKEYKGGQLMISTDRMQITKQPKTILVVDFENEAERKDQSVQVIFRLQSFTVRDSGVYRRGGGYDWGSRRLRVIPGLGVTPGFIVWGNPL